MILYLLSRLLRSSLGSRCISSRLKVSLEQVALQMLFTTINRTFVRLALISGQDNSLSSISSIDDILEERGVELCGEFQRWFDLKRTGKGCVEYVRNIMAQGSANY